MLINPLIKRVMVEISNEATKYANTVDLERRYVKKFLDIFNKLDEDEQIYLFKFIIENLHYRSINTDPDNILTIYNIKFRSFFFIVIITIFMCVLMFMSMSNINIFAGFFDSLIKLFKLFNSI